jgi:hypothetical protein
MKIVSRLLAGALVAVGTFTASAATISWGPVTTITSASSLDQTGALVTAINAGGNQGPQAVGGTDITFNDGGITMAVNGGTVSDSGNGGWYSPTTGDAGLDVVLDSHSYISGINPNGRGQIDITGLTSGVQYRLQVIGVSDDRACCGDRIQTVDDGNGDVSGNLQRSLANTVIGTFTADSSIQSFFVSGDNDPGISAYQVRAVPEPAALGIFGVGAMGLLARRNRKR